MLLANLNRGLLFTTRAAVTLQTWWRALSSRPARRQRSKQADHALEFALESSRRSNFLRESTNASRTSRIEADRMDRVDYHVVEELGKNLGHLTSEVDALRNEMRASRRDNDDFKHELRRALKSLGVDSQ